MTSTEAATPIPELPPGPDPTQTSPMVSAARLALLVGGFVLVGVLANWYLVLVIAAIVVCIFLHELGHFLAARRANMKVTEFFIGFGPRIWSFRRGEVEYGVKAIPAGAYVRIVGMSSVDPVPSEEEGRTYRRGSFWSRMLVAVAGSGMHFLIALLLIWVVLVFHGSTDETRWQVGSESPGSAAVAAGIRPGDTITKVDGVPVATHAEMSVQLRKHPDAEIDLVVERDGRSRTVPVHMGARASIYGTVGEDLPLGSYDGELRVSGIPADGVIATSGVREGDRVIALNGIRIDSLDRLLPAVKATRGGTLELTVSRHGEQSVHRVPLGRAVALSDVTGFLGVGRDLVPERQNPVRAVWGTAQRFGEFVGMSTGQVAALPLRVVEIVDRAINTPPSGHIVTKTPTPATRAAAEQMKANENRPLSIIGAVAIGSDAARAGWASILQFLIAFNIVIGIFNLLPLPPLDGGHVLIACYEKARELLRGGHARYIADSTKLTPVAVVVLVVLVTMGVAAGYLDVADPIRL